MGQGLRPDMMVGAMKEIDPGTLTKLGIRGLILDLDNTLTEWNQDTISPEVVNWIIALKEAGLRACIVSNNGTKRVAAVAESLRLPAIPRAVKPRRGAFRQAMALMGTSCEETAVMGDQLFTDVWGGNRLGLYTILVPPLGGREFIGTRLVRYLERWVLGLLR